MLDLEDPQQGDDAVSTRPFWSGTITFGLVSIPVSLFPANRQARVSLRMLGPNGKPLARRYYAPATGGELSADEMVRGYEIEKDRYIVVTDDELDRLAPEKTRDIDLKRFVQQDAIPPMYFERAYFLTPAGGSSKAYRLLAAIMEESHRTGIATFVMRGKEYLVAILSENGILRAETLRFADEIRSPADAGLPAPAIAEPAQVQKFASAISKLSADNVAPGDMNDDSAERLLELAHGKESRREDVVRTGGPGKHPEVVDILSILKKSLAKAAPKEKSAAGAEDLESQSRSALYETAKSLNIPRRSGMTREQLIQAIRQAA